MPTPWDILQLTSNQNMKSAAFVGGQIESAFNMASKGIAATSDIMSSVTNSALNFRKMQIDSFYKGEELKLAEKAQASMESYRSGELEMRKRGYDIQEQRYADLDERERAKTELAKKNTNAYKFLAAQDRAYTASANGIESEVTISAKALESARKDLDNRGFMMSKAEYKETQDKIKVLEEKVNAGTSQLSKLNGDRSTIQQSINALGNGLIGADDVMKELESSSPSIKSAAAGSKPLGVRTQIDPESGHEIPIGIPAPGSGNIILKNGAKASTEGLGFTAVGDEDDLYDLDDTMRITQGIMQKDPNNSFPIIHRFIEEKANTKTKEYFAAKKMEMEKRYFKNAFNPITMGDYAKEFKDNEDDLTKEYYYYGGTPESLRKLKDEVRDRIPDIINDDSLDTNQKKAAAVNKLIDQKFNKKEEEVKNKNIDANGLATSPPISFDGVLIKPNQRGGYEVTPVNEFPDESDLTVRDKKGNPIGIADKEYHDNSQKQKQAFDEVFKTSFTKGEDGKSKLTTEAIKMIANANVSQFIKTGLMNLKDVERITHTAIASDNILGGTKGSDKIIKNPKAIEILNNEKKKIVNYLVDPKNKSKALKFLMMLKTGDENPLKTGVEPANTDTILASF